MNAPNVVKAGVAMVALAALAVAIITVLPQSPATGPSVASATVAAPSPEAAPRNAAVAPTTPVEPEMAAAQRKLDEALRQGDGAGNPAELSSVARVIGAPFAGASFGATPGGTGAASVLTPAPGALAAGSMAYAGETGEQRAISPPAPAADVSELCARARAHLQDGAVSSARLLLNRAARSGAAEPLALLAQTYDPKSLAEIGASGVKGDATLAKKYYALAAASGSDDARRRLAALSR
jgi:TPR repeat protein